MPVHPGDPAKEPEAEIADIEYMSNEISYLSYFRKINKNGLFIIDTAL